jgi:hypothetical protein
MTYEYVPKVGDRVYALGQNGTFTVAAVHTSPNTADLQLESSDFALRGIPWGVLTLAAKKTREASSSDL